MNTTWYVLVAMGTPLSSKNVSLCAPRSRPAPLHSHQILPSPAVPARHGEVKRRVREACSAVPVCRMNSCKFDLPDSTCTSVLLDPVSLFLMATR